MNFINCGAETEFAALWHAYSDMTDLWWGTPTSDARSDYLNAKNRNYESIV